MRLFDRRRWVFRQTEKALFLCGKLFSLRIVKLFLVAFFIISLSPFILFYFLRPKAQSKLSYGVTFSNKYAVQLGLNWQETYLAILDDLQVKNLRLVAYWDEIEPQRDFYDFGIIKWQLNEARKRGIPVILITGRKVVRYPECYEPAWWEAIAERKERNEELYEFVEKTILELADYENIVMWQIENEPFFPFGECALDISWSELKREIEIVKSLDTRPVLVQDSGEGGLWLPTYLTGDYLAISMYRRIWFDFWGLILGRSVYFQYPLAHWTYKVKGDLLGVPEGKIIVAELQAEPWGPKINSELSRAEKDKTMSRNQFIDTINYAQKTGFKDFYFWGAEWWYFEKEKLNEPFFWNTVKALFN